jgi:hypothetical protein
MYKLIELNGYSAIDNSIKNLNLVKLTAKNNSKIIKNK